MSPLIFDDQGNCWVRDSHAFRKAFHGAWLGADTSAFLIEQAGFIGLSPRPVGPIIHFNPGSVARPALAGFYEWLRRHPCDRLCLAYGASGLAGSHRILGPRLAALREVQALIEQAQGPESRFTSLTERLDTLRSVAAFAALFEHWRTSGAVYEEVAYRPLLKRFARDRYIMFEPRTRDGDLSIVEAGRGLHIPDKQTHVALPGTQLVDVADQAFAHWTAGIYRGVLDRQQPRFDQIHALIHWPRAGRVERRYWRLILPCRTRDGGHRLLGVSCDPGPLDDLDRKIA